MFISSVEHDHIIMPYLSFGSGNETIVILPGISPAPVTPLGESVAAAYAAFAEKYRVILFDRRQNAPAGYTLIDMAEDTVRCLEHLRIRHCRLYGVSQGGMIGALIAAKYPSLSDALCLCSSAISINENAQSVFDRWDNYAAHGMTDELYRSFAEHIYSKDTLSSVPSLLGGPFPPLKADNLTCFRQMLSAFQAPVSLAPYLQKIRCPVMAIASAGDRIFPADQAEKIAELTGGKYYVYSDAFGHGVYDEAADIKERILSFFNNSK